MWPSGGPRWPWPHFSASDPSQWLKHADCGGRSGLKHSTTFCILPYLYFTANTMLRAVLVFAAVCHWGGLTFGEVSGRFDQWGASGDVASGDGKIGAIWAVAVWDIAEMLLLGWLLWILVSSWNPSLSLT